METIDEIMNPIRSVSDIIADLKKKFVTVPLWISNDDKRPGLQEIYDAKLHPVMDKKKYNDKTGKDGVIYVSRITSGLPKLAVRRLSQMCFGIPAKRIYKPKDDNEKKAASILESIFDHNRIDSVNLDRAKRLYAACEFVTIWYTQMSNTMYAGEESKYKLRCRTYSPMDGAKLYPLFDDYDDMIAMSVEYTRMVNNVSTTYFETFTADTHKRWINRGNIWVDDLGESEQDIEDGIGKIAAVYGYRTESIYDGGENNIFELEWALSRNGNYIRRNSTPIWCEFLDPEDALKLTNKPSDDKAARDFRRYPANAKAGYVTWEQAIDSLKFYTGSIRKDFFERIQIPDNSFDEMKTTPMSGEARKMLYVDAQMKVMEESGTWIDIFTREIHVVEAFAKKMFPDLASAFDSLEFEVKIVPFTITDDKDNIDNGINASGGRAIMSRRSAIAKYTDTDDPDAELEQIRQDEQEDASIPLEQPTY